MVRRLNVAFDDDKVISIMTRVKKSPLVARRLNVAFDGGKVKFHSKKRSKSRIRW